VATHGHSCVKMGAVTGEGKVIVARDFTGNMVPWRNDRRTGKARYISSCMWVLVMDC
jgi:hypothetical protein